MPLIQQHKTDLPKNQFRRGGPASIDREQLEYSAQTLFKYGVILFTAVGIGAAFTYMTVQQLKK
jgi:hypothetical protein